MNLLGLKASQFNFNFQITFTKKYFRKSNFPKLQIKK